MQINRGTCQTRHGIEDVVNVLSIAASIWSERSASWSVSQALVISPAAANARCQSPLGHVIPPVMTPVTARTVAFRILRR
jgi:hypothetical protein